MKSNVKPIPDGYHALTPYLYIRGAAKAIDFYKAAFGAEELFRMEGAPGTIGHAELRIGDSIFMLADEEPKWNIKSPETLGGSGSALMVYVNDVDAVYDQAIAAGATIVRPVKDQFYGDRTGCLLDPFGHNWTVATHVEDLSPEEIGQRAKAYMAEMAEAKS